jgi:hypothetical protein
MASLNTSGKTAYVYDQGTDTFYAIGGNTNAAANYNWSGTHEFQNNVVFSDTNAVITAKAGVNNYLNPAARDIALPSPVRGTVCFVRQTSGGAAINDLQFYNGTTWISHGGLVTFNKQGGSGVQNWNLSLDNIGQTMTFDSTSTWTVTIPPNSTVAFPIGSEIDFFRMNTGSVTFIADTGVTLNSKNSNKSIAARYSGVSLFKFDTNTWLLVGDLIA